MSINGFSINGGQINGSGVFFGESVSYDANLDININEGVLYSVTVGIEVTNRLQYSVSLPFFVSQFTQSDPTSRNWRVGIVLDGVNITDSVIGTIEVEAEENSTRIADFSVFSETIPNINSLIGKVVTINYQNITGGLVDLDARIFTGKVDLAEYDPKYGILSYSCIDCFVDDFNKMTKEQVIENIAGFYSEFTFDDDLTGFELAEQLIETIPFSLEKNSEGQIVKSPFFVPASLDYTFTESDVIDESLEVEVTDFRELVNDISLSVDYRYARLIQREGNYAWSGTNPCKTFSIERFLTNNAVDSALDGIGATIKNVTFTPLPPDGFYTCTSVGVDNFFFASDAVRVVTNNGFSADVMRRFDSGVIECFSLSIQSPQSIESFDSQSINDETSIDIEFDASSFANVQSPVKTSGSFLSLGDLADPNDPPAGQLGNGDFFEDQNNEAAFSDGVLSLLNQAKVDILRSHRKNIVSFAKKMEPRIELSQYARLNTSRLKGTGKIGRFVHVLDIDSGRAQTSIELFISRTDSALSVTESDFNSTPTHPSTDVLAEDPSEKIGITLTTGALSGGGPGAVKTVIGGTGSDLPDIEGKNVFLINRKPPDAEPFFESEGLQLSSMEITAEDQGDREFPISQIYDVDIQNNELSLGI